MYTSQLVLILEIQIELRSFYLFCIEGEVQPQVDKCQVWMATQVGADTRNTQ